MVESSLAFDVEEIPLDKIREITKYLVDILRKTENDIDDLCDVVIFNEKYYYHLL